MKTFDLTIVNNKSGHVFNVQEYGNSIEEIEDFWKEYEILGKIGSYHLISCIESK